MQLSKCVNCGTKLKKKDGTEITVKKIAEENLYRCFSGRLLEGPGMAD